VLVEQQMGYHNKSSMKSVVSQFVAKYIFSLQINSNLTNNIKLTDNKFKMEEVFTPLQIELIEAINDSLQNHIYSNAVFLGERLLAEIDCEESRSILAECYMADLKAYKAFHILKDCKSEQNRYKFALVCLKLNKLKEAERALASSASSGNNKYLLEITKPENVPNGSHGLYLLGLISEKLQKQNEAKEFYKKALELNPTLWCAYEKLLKLGELRDPSEIFASNRFKLYENSRRKTASSVLPLTKGPHLSTAGSLSLKSAEFIIEEKPASNDKPLGNIFQPESSHSAVTEATLKNKTPSPTKSLNFPKNSNSVFHIPLEDASGANIFRATQGSSQGANFGNPHSKTYGQIAHQHSKSISSHSNTHNTKHSTSITQNNKKDQIDIEKPSSGEIKDLMSLLTRLAEPYLQLLSYNCQTAIELFNKLPQNHYRTGWVLSNIGRAYWESVKYTEAEKYFKEAFRIEPYRLEGLEYYSSCLWHLKKQVELCTLAEKALEKSLFAPEAWIVLGNCFSLQKEHENALKFFNRAIQLDPTFAYAHTLIGHEYVYNEDFQKARKCFEHALNIDLRHYNAWWGLGYIDYRQEKYDRAIKHFYNAITINSKNPVLHSYLGMTFAAQDELIEALRCFQNSEFLDDKNVMNRFQKANVLCKLERYEQALAELEILRTLMPREAPIPQLIGKIYKQLGMIDKAHNYFTLALDLENKDSLKIKAMLDSLHNVNEFNDDNDL